MEDLRSEQLEALKVMLDYIPKLKKGMENVAKELNGERLADTDAYLSKVIEGLNWVIKVYNGTSSIISEKPNNLDKSAINQASLAFSNAFNAKDDAKLSELLIGPLMTFLNDLEEISHSFF